MANYLQEMTENDYKTYRRISLNVQFSMSEKGKRQSRCINNPEYQELMEEFILKKGEFVTEIEKKENEFYFFKNSTEEVIGMLMLSFKKRKCKIHELLVMESNKGLGTELYKLALERMRANATKTVEVWCLFPGAQKFWKKMGFSPQYNLTFSFEQTVNFTFKKQKQ